MKRKVVGAEMSSENTLPSEYGFSLFFSCISLLIFFSIPATANTETKSGFDFDARVDLKYDDNVFQLTKDDQKNYEEKDPDDVTSNRYTNIHSLSDYILSPRLRLNFETDSFFDGTLSANSWIKYHLYERNDEKNYTEGSVELIQSMGKDGRIRFEGNFEIDYYRENDLSGANDLNENGRITRRERIYSPTIYDEYGGTIAFRHRIRRMDKEGDNWFQTSGVSIEPFVGLRYRRHDNPFKNRDRDIVLGGLIFDFDFGPKIDVDLSYRYEDISTPGHEEVLLVDEVGTDINGDGRLRENAPVMTKVDRSRDRQFYETKISVDYAKDWRGYAEYRLRRDSYKTDNPIDVERYGQKETRHRIRTGVRWNFAEDWVTRLEYTYTHDNSYDGVFEQNQIMLTIRYEF